MLRSGFDEIERGQKDVAITRRVPHSGNVEEFGLKSFFCKTTVENIQDGPPAKVIRTRHQDKSDSLGLYDFFIRWLERSIRSAQSC